MQKPEAHRGHRRLEPRVRLDREDVRVRLGAPVHRDEHALLGPDRGTRARARSGPKSTRASTSSARSRCAGPSPASSTCRARAQRERPALGDRSGSERGGDLDRDLGRVAVLTARVEADPARLGPVQLVLPDHGLALPRRRAPVDVLGIVAGTVSSAGSDTLRASRRAPRADTPVRGRRPATGDADPARAGPCGARPRSRPGARMSRSLRKSPNGKDVESVTVPSGYVPRRTKLFTDRALDARRAAARAPRTPARAAPPRRSRPRGSAGAASGSARRTRGGSRGRR